MTELKTKAQLNWEVGKEQEKKFIDWIDSLYNPTLTFDTKEIFKQIRQNEYRRGKEEGQIKEKMNTKQFRKIIDKAYKEENKEIGKGKLMERINVRVHLHNFRVKILKEKKE